MGFRIDTGLQLPSILLPVPLLKPSKWNNTLLYTEYKFYILHTLFYNFK